jgi:hypothetical protein
VTDLSQFIPMAQQQLTRILNRSGKVLYSTTTTLCPGPIYLLGLNPGGDPSEEPETVGESLEGLRRGGTNSYLDEVWEHQTCAGKAPLQRRVQWLAHEMGVELQEICAANLIFVRSKNAAQSEYPI